MPPTPHFYFLPPSIIANHPPSSSSNVSIFLPTDSQNDTCWSVLEQSHCLLWLSKPPTDYTLDNHSDSTQRSLIGWCSALGVRMALYNFRDCDYDSVRELMENRHTVLWHYISKQHSICEFNLLDGCLQFSSYKNHKKAHFASHNNVQVYSRTEVHNLQDLCCNISTLTGCRARRFSSGGQLLVPL